MLTPDEKHDLAAWSDFKFLSESSAWQKICDFMDAEVDKALEDVVGCLASNEMKGQLATRWQQRAAMVRGIKGYVSMWLKTRDNIAEELEISDEREPD